MTGLKGAYAALAMGWVMMVPAATFAASRMQAPSWGGGYALALVVYWIGSWLCHQRPERSFQLFGAQMPVCARCAGIYAGAAVAAAVMLFRGRTGPRRDGSSLARGVLLLAVAPGAATLLFEWSTGRMPSNGVRAMSGVPIGAAVSWVVCRAMAATPEGM